jgi:hypothetical protein
LIKKYEPHSHKNDDEELNSPVSIKCTKINLTKNKLLLKRKNNLGNSPIPEKYGN